MNERPLHYEALSGIRRCQMKLKVAWVDTYPGFLNNQIFDSDLHRDNVAYKWQVLRQYLSERGIDLQTYDVFERAEEQPDIYFFMNLDRSSLSYVLRKRIRGYRLLLWANETKVDSGRSTHHRFMWRFLQSVVKRIPIFSIVFTYDRQLIDGKRFRKLMLPQPFFASHRTYWERRKMHFANMIVGNKRSSTKGELFSLRQVVIRYFEEHHPDMFDLYGTGWNEPHSDFHTSLYRGAPASKLEMLANYKFTFCPDNQRYPDYIDEKIFDALFAGSVPVYIGAPNVAEYIPEGCFVDWQKYSSLDDLFADLVEIAESDRLEAMRECGWDFLNSGAFYPFSIENFCQVVYRAIIDLQGKRT